MQRDRDKKLKLNTTICQILGTKCAEENAFADFHFFFAPSII